MRWEKQSNLKGPKGDEVKNPRLVGKNLVVDEVLYTPSGTVVNPKILGDATGAQGEPGPRGLPGADAMPQAEAAAEWLNAAGTPLNDAFQAQLATAAATPNSSFRQQFDSLAPSAPATSRDIYVSLVGSDTNDGLTANTPVRTLAKASSLLPEVIRFGNVWRIFIAPGDYNETLRPSHRVNEGQIFVIGQGTVPTDVRFNQVLITAISGYLELTNVAVKERFSQAQFWFRRCPWVVLTDVEGMGDPASDISASGRIGVLSDEGSAIWIRGKKSRMTYKRYFARANYGSRIHCDDVDPSLDANGVPTNLIGIGARHGGFVSLSEGTQPRGLNGLDRSVDTGGLLIDGRGFRRDLGRDEVGLVDQWTSVNSPARKKFWTFRRPDAPAVPSFDATRKLRLSFDSALRAVGMSPVMQTGGLEIEVTFQAQISDTQSIFQKKTILANVLPSGSLYVVSQLIDLERYPAGYAPDKNTVITAANNAADAGTFRVDVFPQIVTQADNWSIDVAISHQGIYSAPVLKSIGLA